MAEKKHGGLSIHRYVYEGTLLPFSSRGSKFFLDEQTSKGWTYIKVSDRPLRQIRSSEGCLQSDDRYF